MVSQLEVAKNRLFEKESLGALNVKFFPGNSRDVSPEQFAEQFNKVISQIETGDYDEVSEID